MIQVKTFYAFNELRNFSYLIFDDESGEAWAIDPWDATSFIDYIKRNSLSLKGILNTHQHFDHVRGNAPLMHATGCSVKAVHGGEGLKLGGEISLMALDTPGHTMDHQVFTLNLGETPFALFSGDTLFNAGVGNCKHGGDVDLLYETTIGLMGLPPETRLYPGHDYIQRNLEFALQVEPENEAIKSMLAKVKDQPVESRGQDTLKDELAFNPFLRLGSKEIRERVLSGRKFLENEGEVERNLFHKLRALRDNW